jgi:hypothetical protein
MQLKRSSRNRRTFLRSHSKSSARHKGTASARALRQQHAQQRVRLHTVRVCFAGTKNVACSCSVQEQAAKRVEAMQEFDQRRPVDAPQYTRRQHYTAAFAYKTLNVMLGCDAHVKFLKLGQVADRSHGSETSAEFKIVAC